MIADLCRDGQLALFPRVVAERKREVARLRARWARTILQDRDASTVLAHAGAVLSPYQVDAKARRWVNEALQASETLEEARDHFLSRVEALGKAVLFD
jgi:hypothetical protein